MSNKKSVGKNVPPFNLTEQLVRSATEDPITVSQLHADLNDLHDQALNMLSQPARIGSVLRSNIQELQENLSAEEFTQLSDGAGVMVKDLTKYRTDIDNLKKEADGLDWASDDVLELQQPTLYLHEKYHELILSFTTVVLPVSASMDGLVRLAAKNLTAKKSLAAVTAGDKNGND